MEATNHGVVASAGTREGSKYTSINFRIVRVLADEVEVLYRIRSFELRPQR
jgi:hypothetical protein